MAMEDVGDPHPPLPEYCALAETVVLMAAESKRWNFDAAAHIIQKRPTPPKAGSSLEAAIAAHRVAYEQLQQG